MKDVVGRRGRLFGQSEYLQTVLERVPVATATREGKKVIEKHNIDRRSASVFSYGREVAGRVGFVPR